MAVLADAALNLLFPKRCPWCGKVLGFTKAPCCETEALKREQYAVGNGELRQSEWLEGVWAVYYYEGPVRTGIRAMKFSGRQDAAAEMGREMAAVAKAEGLAEKFDLLVPVPVSKQTLHERGYNQSLLLARQVAKQTGLPVCTALAKHHHTPRQSSMGREGRRANVLGSFSVDVPAEIEGRRVLLVDDIVTTGATLNECAKMLLAAGAANVGALCIASAPLRKAKDGTGTAEALP